MKQDTMKHAVLQVALLGMSEKGISTFSYFIKKQVAHQLKQTSDLDAAEVFIADFDTEIGISQWHQYARICEKPAILISVENPNKANSVWVKKPVVSRDLELAVTELVKLAVGAHEEEKATVTAVEEKPVKQTLQVVEPKVQVEKVERKTGYQRDFSDDNSPNLSLSKEEIVECCGVREDIDPAQADFIKQVCFSDEKTLLASVKKGIHIARDKNCVVYIQGLPLEMAILPGAQKVVVELSNRHLRHLCAMPMQVMPGHKLLHVSPLECEGLFSAHHKNMHSVDEVLWQLTLWTARGRLIQPIDPHRKVRFDHWPNFTRLQITPHAIHIAALWTRYSMSPVEMAQAMQVPQRYVFALASAASSVGVLVKDEHGIGMKKQEAKKSHSIFSTILRSLKIA